MWKLWLSLFALCILMWQLSHTLLQLSWESNVSMHFWIDFYDIVFTFLHYFYVASFFYSFFFVPGLHPDKGIKEERQVSADLIWRFFFSFSLDFRQWQTSLFSLAGPFRCQFSIFHSVWLLRKFGEDQKSKSWIVTFFIIVKPLLNCGWLFYLFRKIFEVFFCLSSFASTARGLWWFLLRSDRILLPFFL